MRLGYRYLKLLANDANAEVMRNINRSALDGACASEVQFNVRTPEPAMGTPTT